MASRKKGTQYHNFDERLGIGLEVAVESVFNDSLQISKDWTKSSTSATMHIISLDDRSQSLLRCIGGEFGRTHHWNTLYYSISHQVIMAQDQQRRTGVPFISALQVPYSGDTTLTFPLHKSFYGLERMIVQYRHALWYWLFALQSSCLTQLTSQKLSKSFTKDSGSYLTGERATSFVICNLGYLDVGQFAWCSIINLDDTLMRFRGFVSDAKPLYKDPLPS